MDLSKGYTAKTYLSLVDRNSWLDRESFNIPSGTIQRSLGDLQQSASVTCTGYDIEGEAWMRIWMDALQGQDSVHIPLFTGLATSPSKNIDGSFVTNTIQCYSVLKPAQDILLSPGWYAPVGANAVDLAKELLSVTPAPIEIEGGNAEMLKEAIIAEHGESRLSMALAILYAVDRRIIVNGYGEITIAPLSEETVGIFDQFSNDIVETKISIEHDWFGCPNVFRATTFDGLVAIARDEDNESPLSIQNRGREVWAEESNVNIGTDMTLGEYAMNRLKELQRVSTSINYDRRFVPGINVGDRVAINYPANDISGIFYITSQTIDLGYNAKTSEEAYRV